MHVMTSYAHTFNVYVCRFLVDLSFGGNLDAHVVQLHRFSSSEVRVCFNFVRDLKHAQAEVTT